MSSALLRELRVRRALSLLSGHRRRLSRRVPKQRHPNGVARTFELELRAMLKRVREIVRDHLVPKLPRLVESAQASRRFDGPVQDLDDAFDIFDSEFESAFSSPLIQAIADKAAQMTAAFNAQEVGKQVRSVLGIDLGSEAFLNDAIQLAARNNAALITKMSQQLKDEIRDTVTRGMREGIRHEAIASLLSDRLGVAESRAKLIARDQVSKFNGELTRVRQQSVGVTEYVWSTANDERVRPRHADRDGRRFRWSDPPADGHPGQAVNCRCVAIPVIPDIDL